MVHVHSRKFCCCLPVRMGVFIMTILAVLGGGIVAVAGWIQVKNLRKETGEKSDERAIYIHAIMFSILALIGFFGLVGTIAKRLRLVSLFSTMLSFHLGFSIGTGIYTMYIIFKRNSADAIRDCMNDENNKNFTEDQCKSALKIAKGFIIGIYVVTWLIELYGCIIADQLRQATEGREEGQNDREYPRANGIQRPHHWLPIPPVLSASRRLRLKMMIPSLVDGTRSYTLVIVNYMQ
ncbi:hypothetical protein C8J57DRAFT_367799 [Mycena rebaudengoi]|nr:hypothetical protein C8J57DRAFT_367799 [Mycena rebaudengoi]